MTLRTILAYQFGSRTAIQQAAESKNSLWLGIFLVLLTGVARNYDLIYFRETIRWLFGPLLFSFVSGTFLFVILFFGFIRRHLEIGSRSGHWRPFMALFWLTAPIAWLYAIPVERFLDRTGATQANLLLLALVSSWRVLLLSRIISVLHGVPFLRSVSWVLIPAALEVALVVILGMIFSPSFGHRVMAAMSGIRNAPEEDLLLNALQTSFMVAAAVFIIFVVAQLAKPFAGLLRPLPTPSVSTRPSPAILVVPLIMILIATPGQLEQRRFFDHYQLIAAGKYRESIDYLTRQGPNHFPPSRRLEPNPYELEGVKRLPAFIGTLRPSDPDWIKSMYLQYADITLGHRHRILELKDALSLYTALKTLNVPDSFVRKHRQNILNTSYFKTQGAIRKLVFPDEDPELKKALENLGIDPATK